METKTLELRRNAPDKLINVNVRIELEINSVTHQATLLNKLGLAQIAEWDVDARADQRKCQSLTGNLTELSRDAKILLADSYTIPHLRVELQHHLIIDQRFGAALKVSDCRRRFRFQRAVIGKLSANSSDLDEPR